MKKPQQKLLPAPKEQALLPHEACYSDEWLEWTRAICSLNDAFRLNFTSTELYASPDLLKLSIDDQATILNRIRNYRNFNATNDPHMTHHQGFFLHEDIPVVWTIYYHEQQEKPLHQLRHVDIDLTRRHMMVMTADEWWGDLPENVF